MKRAFKMKKKNIFHQFKTAFNEANNKISFGRCKSDFKSLFVFSFKTLKFQTTDISPLITNG